MAASLASIAETWPENVLPPIGSRKSLTRKIMFVPFLFSFFFVFSSFFGITLGPDGYTFRGEFSAQRYTFRGEFANIELKKGDYCCLAISFVLHF